MSKTKTPEKTISLNEKYEIDKEMAHLLEFCNGHENFKNFFLNHFFNNNDARITFFRVVKHNAFLGFCRFMIVVIIMTKI